MSSDDYEVYLRKGDSDHVFSPTPFPNDEKTEKMLAGMSKTARAKMINQLDDIYSSLRETASNIIDWRNLVAKSIGDTMRVVVTQESYVSLDEIKENLAWMFRSQE